jgi:hypothetical protein
VLGFDALAGVSLPGATAVAQWPHSCVQSFALLDPRVPESQMDAEDAARVSPTRCGAAVAAHRCEVQATRGHSRGQRVPR